MAFIIESTQRAACTCRRIVVIENQDTLISGALVKEQWQALHDALESLLSLITIHRAEIGALHVLELCNRLLSVTRSLTTKQVIISFGLTGLSRLLDNDSSELRIQECADIFIKLFTKLPPIDKTNTPSDCQELLQALLSCRLMLSSTYISSQVMQSVVDRLEYFILSSKTGDSNASEEHMLPVVELYCNLLNKEPSDHKILSTIFSRSINIELMIKVLSIARSCFKERELNVALSQVMEHVFSSPSLSARTILCLGELLYNVGNPGLCDLFGVLVDGLVQPIIKGLDITATLNIETSDRALIQSQDKLELRKENFDTLLTYLQSPTNVLREPLANYLLDSLLAMLNLNEISEPNTITLVLIYLELLAQTDVYSNIFYTNDIYLWLANKLSTLNFEEVVAHPYWYEHSSLISGHHTCDQCPGGKIILPQLADIVQIVAKTLPVHMFSQMIEPTAKDTFSRTILLGNVFISNTYYTNHEVLVKTLLNSFNIIIHYHPIPSLVELADNIIKRVFSLSNPSEISTDNALLLMMCVFYSSSILKNYHYGKSIEEYSVAAIEYVSMALFEAFHVSTDALNLSIKSLLVIFTTALHHAPISSLSLIVGVRDTLISRWNRIVAIEGPVFSQTNFCLYTSFLTIIEYHRRIVDPIILIVNTQLQEYSSLDLFQELSSMYYTKDLNEDGFNRYNDGENVALLTPFGHALLMSDWGTSSAKFSAQYLSALSCFGDSLALILPILMRGLNDTLDGQDTATTVLVALLGTVHVQIKAALQLFSLSQIPLPYKLAYRIDPYHNAMMPRSYKSNEPRAEDQTYNLLLSLCIKASTLFVDENGNTRLQAADIDWLSLFKNGHDASRTILHNCFDAFFFRAQQTAISKEDRLLLIGGLSFAEALFELDAEYLRSKKAIICNTLHYLLFFSSALPPPHILYLLQRRAEDHSFKASFTDMLSLVRSGEPYNQKIVANLRKNKALIRLLDVSVSLFAHIAQDFAEAAPPILILDVLSFFCCKYYDEKIINTVHSILKLFIAKHHPWNQEECPPEETIEGAAARLPIYDDGVSIKQGDIKQWAKAVLATEELFETYESLDVQAPNSPNGLLLQQYLDPSVWPIYSSASQNTIEILGQGHDAQTFVERKHSNLDRQRACLYIFINKEIKQTLQSFIERS
ncbi:Hypothetical protein GLP15_1145 [Giardia lamblia P15]|uniref:Uncharacterized protein n=1 Tax=Giardia intestinalis (strain P15) TaxID=658858 RepID=E1F8L7_GIAIA|nr:Hypothetical protein GLP15_1145 [Giardia lamblia P15]